MDPGQPRKRSKLIDSTASPSKKVIVLMANRYTEPLQYVLEYPYLKRHLLTFFLFLFCSVYFVVCTQEFELLTQKESSSTAEILNGSRN